MGCCQCSARGVPLQCLGSLSRPGAIPRRNLNSALKIGRPGPGAASLTQTLSMPETRTQRNLQDPCGHPVRRHWQFQCLRGGLVQVASDDGTRERGCHWQWPGCRRRQGVGTVAQAPLRRTMTVPRQGLPLADFNSSNSAQAQAASGSRAESEPLA
jgi:hypothetical protein